MAEDPPTLDPNDPEIVTKLIDRLVALERKVARQPPKKDKEFALQWAKRPDVVDKFRDAVTARVNVERNGWRSERLAFTPPLLVEAMEACGSWAKLATHMGVQMP